METLIPSGIEGGYRITIDPVGAKMYWTAGMFAGDPLIQRANLDGADYEILPIEDTFPGGIAIIPEPSTLALLVLGGLTPLLRRS